MTAEISRRRFVTMAGVAAAGLLLPESEGLDRAGNRNELNQFLAQPFELTQPLRDSVGNLLELVGKDKTSDLGFAHNANTLDRFERSIEDMRRQVVEIDCRIDGEGPYIAHDKGGKSDIDPLTAYDIVVSSPYGKALKYDFKEADAIGGVLSSIDPDRPCILNADLFHNSGFNLTPEEFVGQSKKYENALLSIGKNGEFKDDEAVVDFVQQFIRLAKTNTRRDFILPAPLIGFMNYFEELKNVLALPNTHLMIYRTSDITLTQRHVNWVKESFSDDIRARTFFDL